MTDNDLGSLLGDLLGGEQGRPSGQSREAGNLLASLLHTIGSDGGGNPLSGLLQQLHDGGLGEKSQSWVGAGQNQSISGVELAQALPYQALDHVAQQAGISPEHAADQLAQVLPETVDKLTPHGEVPQVSLEDLLRRQ
ncbi:YidB family protein [Streptomyces sp. NPDC050636]|uniref:YidB family protein n=1 Tax=Streptomyces sp. NPDC050636 TaxID=3154510 RepID=UPI00343A4D81